MPYSLPYDPVEVHDLIDAAILLIHSKVDYEGKKAWLDWTQEYNSVGEWELAYDGLCTTLYINNLPIAERTYQLLEQIGRAMTLHGSEQWERLNPLVREMSKE